MKLVIGLGNPGEEYQNNRHNIGYLFLDYIVQKKEVSSINYQVSSVKPFKKDKYSEAEITEIKLNNETIILAKPQTFMNESGRAVKKIVSSMKYKKNSCEESQEFFLNFNFITLNFITFNY